MAESKEEILEVLKQNLVERGVEPEKVAPQADLQADLGLDSLDVVELTTGIEERFGIEIPDAELEGLATVEDAANLVLEKVGTRA